MNQPDPATEENNPLFRPIGVWLILIANAVVFLGMVEAGASASLVSIDDLVASGGLLAVRVWQGEIWRLFSALFVHGAWWHLALNMFVFWQVGQLLERFVGTTRFLLIYFASGLFGFALSILVQPGMTVGASGAVFGIVGALLGVATITRGLSISQLLFSSLKPFVVATLLLGLLIPFVDSSAHVGGLIMGYLLIVALHINEPLPPMSFLDDVEEEAPRTSSHQSQRNSLLGMAICFFLFASTLALSVRPVFSPVYATQMSWDLLRRGDFIKAQKFSEQAHSMAPDDLSVRVLRARMAMGEKITSEHELKRLTASESRSQQLLQSLFDDLKSQSSDEALQEALMMVGQPTTSDHLFFDEMISLGLCQTALTQKAKSITAAALNNCAWFYLKAGNRHIANADKGLELATRAYQMLIQEDSEWKDLNNSEKNLLAAVIHTYAEAHAQTGNPLEASRLMQRILVQELSRDPLFIEDEDRFSRMARRQEKAKNQSDALPLTDVLPAQDKPPLEHPEQQMQSPPDKQTGLQTP